MPVATVIATVIATVSSEEKAERALAGGAHHVIDYRREDVAARVRELTDGQGAHHVVEVDFGGNIASTLASIAMNGSLAYYATKGAPTPVVPAGAAGSTDGICSSPSRRSTSSTRSAGWVRSGRQVGGVTCKAAAPDPSAVTSTTQPTWVSRCAAVPSG